MRNNQAWISELFVQYHFPFHSSSNDSRISTSKTLAAVEPSNRQLNRPNRISIGWIKTITQSSNGLEMLRSAVKLHRHSQLCVSLCLCLRDIRLSDFGGH